MIGYPYTKNQRVRVTDPLAKLALKQEFWYIVGIKDTANGPMAILEPGVKGGFPQHQVALGFISPAWRYADAVISRDTATGGMGRVLTHSGEFVVVRGFPRALGRDMTTRPHNLAVPDGEVLPQPEVVKKTASYYSTPASPSSLWDQMKRSGVAQPIPQAVPANPKQLYGDKKPPLQLIHSIALLHESAAMKSGALKYGENNFLDTPVEAMTYVGAIKRHLEQWTAGERVDAKELVHHLGAIRACCNILLTAEACGSLIDNRPGSTAPVSGVPGMARKNYAAASAQAFAEVEKTIEHLNKLYPSKV